MIDESGVGASLQVKVCGSSFCSEKSLVQLQAPPPAGGHTHASIRNSGIVTGYLGDLTPKNWSRTSKLVLQKDNIHTLISRILHYVPDSIGSWYKHSRITQIINQRTDFTHTSHVLHTQTRHDPL